MKKDEERVYIMLVRDIKEKKMDKFIRMLKLSDLVSNIKVMEDNISLCALDDKLSEYYIKRFIKLVAKRCLGSICKVDVIRIGVNGYRIEFNER